MRHIIFSGVTNGCHLTNTYCFQGEISECKKEKSQCKRKREDNCDVKNESIAEILSDL